MRLPQPFSSSIKTKTKTKPTTLLLLLLLATVVVSEDTCSSDSDCASYFTCQDSECKHKKVWPPTLLEAFGILSILVVTIASSASGIGGGGIIVPLSIIILQFEAKQAIALSNGLIFANGTTKSIISMFRSHPTIKDRTVIDYNIILIFMPAMILGAFLGSLLGQMAPNIFQLLLLNVVLFLTIVKSIWNGVSRCKSENKALKEQTQVAPENKEAKEKDLKAMKVVDGNGSEENNKNKIEPLD